MGTEKVIKSTQEQAVAAWIDQLNLQRISRVFEAFRNGDINLSQALAELQKLIFFSGDPTHILGTPATKHGEIAENAQVYISNARRLIEGLTKEYSFDGVGRTAPEDYIKNGQLVQSKFLNGIKSTLNGNGAADGIKQHLAKYPWFVKNGGSYDIPKDQYDEIMRLLNLRQTTPTLLTREDLRLLKAIDSFTEETGLNLSTDVRPSVVGYNDVQQGTIGQTISKEERALRARDQQLRREAVEVNQPTLEEGIHVAGSSAAIEGSVSFIFAVNEKLKAGKSLSQFTTEDWKDVGIDTGVGILKGGIRGGSIYALTNFTATSAPIASASVTAVFGMLGLAIQLEQGNISAEEFITGSQATCLEAGVSAVSSLIGQTLIPVPILGAVIGNATGMFAYSIAKDYLGKAEQDAIAGYIARIDELNAQLEEQYQRLLAQLNAEFKRFKSLLDFAFDLDVNVAFFGSIGLADQVGVPKGKILRTPDDVTRYFTE